MPLVHGKYSVYTRFKQCRVFSSYIFIIKLYWKSRSFPGSFSTRLWRQIGKDPGDSVVLKLTLLYLNTGFMMMMITPFRKFLKHITNWTKQGNLALLWLGSLTLTTVWMALSRNERLLDTASKDHGAIYQLKLRSNHLHRTFELHCTTNFSCKEALNRPRLPFLPLLLISSY